MEKPPTSVEATRRSSRPRAIKINTEEDTRGYFGLKLGSALEDDLALASSKKPEADPEKLRGKIRPEPKNVPPPQTPDWTSRRLDEEQKSRAKAKQWAIENKAEKKGRDDGGLYWGEYKVRERGGAMFCRWKA